MQVLARRAIFVKARPLPRVGTRRFQRDRQQADGWPTTETAGAGNDGDRALPAVFAPVAIEFAFKFGPALAYSKDTLIGGETLGVWGCCNL